MFKQFLKNYVFMANFLFLFSFPSKRTSEIKIVYDKPPKNGAFIIFFLFFYQFLCLKKFDNEALKIF